MRLHRSHEIGVERKEDAWLRALISSTTFSNDFSSVAQWAILRFIRSKHFPTDFARDGTGREFTSMWRRLQPHAHLVIHNIDNVFALSGTKHHQILIHCVSDLYVLEPTQTSDLLRDYKLFMTLTPDIQYFGSLYYSFIVKIQLLSDFSPYRQVYKLQKIMAILLVSDLSIVQFSVVYIDSKMGFG